ncbi:MAG: hypothetical protein WAS07_10150 [Micropruina sp.]
MKATRIGLVAFLALTAASCGIANPSVTSPGASPTPLPVLTSAEPTTSASTGSCAPTTPVPAQGPAAQMQVLAEGGQGGPRVSGVVYPRPTYQGRLWSQWGQGVVLDDGRFISAIGDHQGVDGNSFLFVYEPDGRLTRISDVLSLVDHQKGSFGYGKIHAQLVKVACDLVVFGTYWGTRTDLRYSGSYTGDHLFSLNTSTWSIESLGVPIPEHGIPSLAGHGGLVYGEAADPRGRPAGQSGDVGEFFVFDPNSRKVVYRSDDQRHIGFRSMGVDSEGRAFLAMPKGGLLRYVPGGELTVLGGSVGPGWLRATTEAAPDGTVYAVTTEPDRYVAIRTDGTVDDLGAAAGYSASIALSPAGDEIYVVPGAKGNAWERGAPLLAVNVTTGKERVVAELEPLVKERLGLVLGGSYNVAVDRRSGRIFVGFNAGATSDNPWGEVVLLTVEP